MITTRAPDGAKKSHRYSLGCNAVFFVLQSLYYDGVTAYIFEKHLRKKELIKGYFGAQSSELLEKTLLVSPKNVFTYFVFSQNQKH